jgi:cobalt-zinc-cadmium efflux system outer membrane protein
MVAILAVLLIQGPAPTPLSLDSALRRAIALRGRVAEAGAGVAEARAGRRLAGQVPNPSLSYEHTADPPRQHLLFEQPLSWLTTRGSSRGAAAAAIRRARADSASLVASVAQEVREAFYAALGAHEVERLTREEMAATDSFALIARRRLEAGDISRFESEQAAQESRRGRQLLSEAREEARAADAAFARAVGWSEALPPSPAGALDQGVELAINLGLPPDSMPQVVSAVADSASFALEWQATRRGRWPIPSVIAGAEWDDPDGERKALSVFGFAVPLPLWNTGGAEAALARARAERAAALAREARLESIRARTEALARLEESALRARFARDSLVPAARALREQALNAYRAGETDILAVLDALRGEREIVRSELTSLRAFQGALASWLALFGRIE